MNKCNYPSKEQCSPMKNEHGFRVGLKKSHGDHTYVDIVDGCKREWWRPKRIIVFEENRRQFMY